MHNPCLVLFVCFSYTCTCILYCYIFRYFHTVCTEQRSAWISPQRRGPAQRDSSLENRLQKRSAHASLWRKQLVHRQRRSGLRITVTSHFKCDWCLEKYQLGKKWIFLTAGSKEGVEGDRVGRPHHERTRSWRHRFRTRARPTSHQRSRTPFYP